MNPNPEKFHRRTSYGTTLIESPITTLPKPHPCARIKVLIITEKPLVARCIFKFLTDEGYKCVKGLWDCPDLSSCPVAKDLNPEELKFSQVRGNFRGAESDIYIAGVLGHICSLDTKSENLKTVKNFPDRFSEGYRDRGDVLRHLLSLLGDGAWKSRVRVLTETGERLHQSLLKLAHGANHLVIATDRDLEGENLGYCLAQLVRTQMEASTCESTDIHSRMNRMVFGALENSVLKRAWDKVQCQGPSRWLENNCKVNAVDAKHSLDLCLGYTVHRVFKEVLREQTQLPNVPGITFGTCQTPALSLIVEKRNRSYMDDEGKGLAKITAEIQVAEGQVLKVEHTSSRLSSLKAAKDALQELRDIQTTFVSSQVKEVNQIAQRPGFGNTIDLLAEFSRRLGLQIDCSDFAKVLENAYLHQQITYPRTLCRKLPRTVDLNKVFERLICHGGDTELNDDLRHLARSRSSLGINEEDEMVELDDDTTDDYAHSCVYPLRGVSENLIQLARSDEEKHTALIVRYMIRRFVACFLPCAKYDTETLQFNVGGLLDFTAERRVMKKDGFARIFRQGMDFDESKLEDLNKVGTERLALSPGATVPVKSLKAQLRSDVFLTESDLLFELEGKTIGTDGTIPNYVHKLITDGLVKLTKEKKLVPRPFGLAVYMAFRIMDKRLVDVSLRGKIEGDVQRIAVGDMTTEDFMRKFLDLYRPIISAFVNDPAAKSSKKGDKYEKGQGDSAKNEEKMNEIEIANEKNIPLNFLIRLALSSTNEENYCPEIYAADQLRYFHKRDGKPDSACDLSGDLDPSQREFERRNFPIGPIIFRSTDKFSHVIIMPKQSKFDLRVLKKHCIECRCQTVELRNQAFGDERRVRLLHSSHLKIFLDCTALRLTDEKSAAPEKIQHEDIQGEYNRALLTYDRKKR